MPPRKRNRRQPEHPDPLVRFAKALDRAKAAERAEQQRIQAEREAAKLAERLAAEHAAKLADANAALDRAIARVKACRGSGTGVAEADAEYRAAKALVIELETGERPSWAPTGE